MMIKIISKSIVLSLVLAFVQVPLASDAHAADSKKEERAKRKTKAMSPFIGKKVNAAFELYSKDDIPAALVILKDIDTDDKFDKATVDRYIAIMYATLGEHEDEAIKYLKIAVKPDVLNTNDQAEAIKLLADLLLMKGEYKEALTNYYTWMDFTGKSNGDVWAKVANAHYQLKELSKVITPADNAIEAFGKKQNKNPYILKLTAYYEMKKYKEAVDVLETAVQIFPEDASFWTQLGTFYVLAEDYKRSLETMALAHKKGFLTKSSQIRTLASLYSQHDVPYKSAKLYEKYMASGLLKKNRNNLSAVAGAWQSAMHTDKAAKYYGELAKLTDDPKHYVQEGMLLKQDEQFSKAIIALNKALDKGAKNPGTIYMSIAESYFYLEKYKQAYAAIKKAAKDPKTKKVAKGWTGFIRDTAARKNVSI